MSFTLKIKQPSLLTLLLCGLLTAQSACFSNSGKARKTRARQSIQNTAVNITEGVPLLTNARQARFSFVASTIESGAKLETICRLDNQPEAVCQSPVELKNIPDGEHIFTVTARIQNQSKFSSAVYRWKVETRAPLVQITQAVPLVNNLPSAEFHFAPSSLAAPIDYYLCRIDSSEFKTCTTPVKYSGLAQGDHVVEIKVRDKAGNESAPAPYRWSISLTAPTVQILTAPTAPVEEGASAQFTFTSPPQAAGSTSLAMTHSCSVDSAAFSPCTSPYTSPPLTLGNHSLKVKARDSAGNESAPATATWIVVPKGVGEFDLDLNGTNESDLTPGACASGKCITVKSVTLGLDFSLPVETAVEIQKIIAIGKHGGTGLSRVAVSYKDAGGQFSIIVFELSTRSVIAFTKAPASAQQVYQDAARNNQGNSFPFMAPGWGTVAGGWNDLCIFRPGTAANACGLGFAAVSIMPADTELFTGQSFFREAGGYLQDIDGDQWEDIHLIYHFTLHTISSRTLAPINTIGYNVAPSMGTDHSGRNYGSVTGVTSSNGKLRTVIFGGPPLGIFSDTMCAVSRFVAVLESTPGIPSSRRLAWSNFYGFHSTIFESYAASYAAAAPFHAPAKRLGDYSNQCIHRFSDGRSKLDSTEVIVVNVFNQAPSGGVSLCLPELFGYYLGNAQPWYTCQAGNAKSRGSWGMQVLRESDGAVLTTLGQSYTWGWSDKFLPSGETVYLVEALPASMSWDFSDVPPTAALSMRSIRNGAWYVHGSLPSVGRPRILFTEPQRHRGVGAPGPYPELDLLDRDKDGLMDLQMGSNLWNGTGVWSGWSSGTSSWVLKN